MAFKKLRNTALTSNFFLFRIIILEVFLLCRSRGARNSELMLSSRGCDASVVVNVGDDGQVASRKATPTRNVGLRGMVSTLNDNESIISQNIRKSLDTVLG